MTTQAVKSNRLDARTEPAFSRVAAAVDGFEEGNDAAVLGAALAGATGAELMLVGVTFDPLIPPMCLDLSEMRKQTESDLMAVRAVTAPSARVVTEMDVSVPTSWDIGAQGMVQSIWQDILREDLTAVERELAEAEGASEASFESDVRFGPPVELLHELCDQVDLLVIGSRRWGSAARVLLGSVGESLLQAAGCSVLAVPRPRR